MSIMCATCRMAFWAAAESGNLEVVQRLLLEGQDVNALNAVSGFWEMLVLVFPPDQSYVSWVVVMNMFHTSNCFVRVHRTCINIQQHSGCWQKYGALHSYALMFVGLAGMCENTFTSTHLPQSMCIPQDHISHCLLVVHPHRCMRVYT